LKITQKSLERNQVYSILYKLKFIWGIIMSAVYAILVVFVLFAALNAAEYGRLD